MAKMTNYIDLDTPSDNGCGTFKYFRAVTLYRPVCRSDRLIVGFDQDGEYLIGVTDAKSGSSGVTFKIVSYKMKKDEKLSK